jgi:hypothetical protein
MYNLRYHIASLVSVFLALALGLVLGGLIVRGGTFDRQGEALVEGLQKEFADLRAENRELSGENEQLTEISAEMIDAWAVDRLAGQTVVVLANAGRDDGLVAAREAISGAGGRVAVVTMLSPRFGLDEEDLAARVTSLAPDPDRAEASIAASLAAEWTSAQGERPLTAALVEAGVLSIDGWPEDARASALVNLSAPDGKPDRAALAVTQAARRMPIPAVAAETPKTQTRVAATAAAEGISAFDTLGTPVGRCTLIALLSGSEGGFYGTAQSAEALFPPLQAP